MIVCAKCGASNAPGDAFCGDCGAYLEWAAGPEAEGEAATEPEAATEAEREAAEAPAEPGPEPRAPAVPPDPAGPTCPACGRVNAVGRTFCQSCGERLPAGAAWAFPPAIAPRLAPAPPPTAPRAAAVSPPVEAPQPAVAPYTDQAAALSTVPAEPAPVAAARPTPARPAAPVVEPHVRPEVRRGPAPEAGAGPGGNRILVVGAVVVLLAVVAIGGFMVLGGGGGATASASPTATAEPTPAGSEAPTAEATAEPSIEPTLEPSAEPSVEPTPAPTTEITPAPTPAGPAMGITITKATASTQNGSKFAAAKAIDGSPLTAWAEGAKDAEGQWLEVTIPPTAVTRIVFSAGIQASRDAYDGNPRPKNVTIAFDGGTPFPLALTDTFGQQRVDIPAGLGITAATTIRITIIDAYAAKKTGYAGSPTSAIGFSEVRVFGVPATP